MLQQANRTAEFITPLGKDILVFKKLEVVAELGRDFVMTVDALSELSHIDADQILGQSAAVRFNLPEGGERYFNGLVAGISSAGRSGDYLSYRLVLRPWLWYLTLTHNCRIFQHKTAPDIIKEVFRAHGFSDFEDRLKETYRQRTYCVQYRESDFAFVSRLLEEEGIYYYFLHERDKHTLVLADGYSAHTPMPEYEEVPYYPLQDQALRERDHIYEWHRTHEVCTGACTLKAFNFTRPGDELKVESRAGQKYAQGHYEHYDYPGPGRYEQEIDGQHYARVRMEALHGPNAGVQGAGNAIGLQTGALFKLRKFPDAAENREYLLTQTTHVLQAADYQTGDGGAGVEYQVSFSATDSRQAFRADASTPRPVMQGPQTAVVVGPAGEEIYTDRYGRVKVQFHWDRQGRRDANSSCWIRVAHAWAGKGWGAISIPRIGQEVIVEFLEGDPDQPIITGRVYNNDNMPPYGLPGAMTQMGIKSRSTKGATDKNFNELRFEDKKGSEEVFVQAEKDCNIVVKNDQTDQVRRHKNLTVGGDFASEITQECWTKAQRVVVTAAQEIYLQVGGSFISISANGIVLQGQKINLNCGDAPSSDAPPAGSKSGGA